jgi:hypothetical protein
MVLRNLSKVEQDLVFQSLKAIAEGTEIGDWEFHSRLGVGRATLKELISKWPNINDSVEDSDEFLAINNCLNEVCNGIRWTAEAWSKRFTQPKKRFEQTYKAWLLNQKFRGDVR